MSVGPALVKARVHPGGDLDSTGERETNVHAVAHFVGRKGAFDFVDQLFVRRNFRKRERAGGTAQAGEVFV